MNVPYEPIACGFHSVLAEAVCRGDRREILYRTPSGARWCVETVARDLFAQGREEYVQLEAGRLRLDRIERIGNAWPSAGGVTRTPGVELGRAVLQAAAKEAERVFGERLRAAYALGSLAHGGFAPNVSDVDLGLVLGGPLREEDEACVQCVVAQIHDAPMPLAGRLSVFWGSPASLRGEVEGGRFPAIDRLDLVRHGELLLGEDVREAGFLPEQCTLDVESAKFALRRLAALEHMERLKRPRRIITGGLVKLTKAILLPARLLYTAATGEVAPSTKAAAHYRSGHSGPAADLVAEGVRLRTEPLKEEKSLLQLLEQTLPALYAECATAWQERMAAHGENDLSRRLAAWQKQF